MQKKILIILIPVILFIVGCSGGSNQSQSPDYEATKKMVTDIVKSEDGKKAIVEILAEETTQQLYVIHDDTVNKAIQETLTSEKGKEFWAKMFTDHEFVKAFSESMITQQEDVFKRLMADSSYQEKMLELFENPEFAKLIQTQLKSQQFKGHLEESIQQTLESPLFKATLTEIVIQNAKKIVGENEGGSESGEKSGGSNGQSGN